ncbi:MAG: hypothetical protein J5958_06985 [Clostridia bacterium]|nr:hypothetical protein [Clostridia bacterium]
MADLDERLKAEKDKSEKPEGKRSIRILSQVIALIICLLLSFSVWLAIHYREDRKNEPTEPGGEAASGYSEQLSVL